MTSPEQITFSFGQNWQRFLDELHPRSLERMAAYVTEWLGDDVAGRRVIDIGSGQGLTSLVVFQAGAAVTSLDVDPNSVAATSRLRARAGDPPTWRVIHGSILDPDLVTSLGAFDVVISWGVLHHTGDVWTAVDHAAALVAPGGRLWLALYHRTAKSGRSVRIKRMYNRTPRVLKPLFRGARAAPSLVRMTLRRDFSPIRDYHQERGMSWWRDIEDWLGGLPYEPVGPGQLIARLRPLGFDLIRLEDALWEGDNDVYLFVRAPRADGA